MKLHAGIALIALGLSAGACAKDSEAPSKAPPAAEAPPMPDPAVEAAKAAAEAEAKAKAEAEKAAQERAAEVAKALAELEAETAKDAERWTPELEAKVAKLVAKNYPSVKKALAAIMAGPHRKPGNSDRDAYRHPVETLTFFGIQPTMTVVEVGSGAGWYTELLAPLLAKKGKLYAVSGDPNGPADSMATVYGKRLQAFLAQSRAAYGAVEMVAIDPPANLELGPPGSADMVVAIREMHNWHRNGALDAYLAAIHAVLKDGGSFGVVQHRAAADANADESAQKGYLPEAWLIEKIQAAGFELVDKSEINANPKDTKDYEQGVWTLPPGFALGDKDRDKYAAIGESDRMTLKFKAVAKPQAAAGEQPAGEDEPAAE
jgi:predicted methyltransferase